MIYLCKFIEHGVVVILTIFLLLMSFTEIGTILFFWAHSMMFQNFGLDPSTLSTRKSPLWNFETCQSVSNTLNILKLYIDNGRWNFLE